jgi:hypothetical protein
LSTAFSYVPSVVPTEDLYPELARSIQLDNAVRVQGIYNQLLETIIIYPNDPQYRVIKTFLWHAKKNKQKVSLQAIEAGLELNTPEFETFLNDNLTGNTILVRYLTNHGLNLSTLLS